MASSSTTLSSSSSSTTSTSTSFLPSSPDNTNLVLILVGNHGVGKTTLLTRYLTGHLPPDFKVDPTFEQSQPKSYQPIPGEVTYQVMYRDTTSYPDYDRLRPLQYPGSHVILLCYACNDKASLTSVTDKWLHEIEHHLPGYPVILVGTKTDLQYSHIDRYVTTAEGDYAAKRIGARHHYRCSAYSGGGIDLLFSTANGVAQQCLLSPPPPPSTSTQQSSTLSSASGDSSSSGGGKASKKCIIM